MRVMIDIDGVLADFIYGFTALAAHLGLVERPWSTPDQPTWKFSFPVDAVWREVDAHPEWWLSLPALVIDAEVEALNEACEFHTIWYMTNRRGALDQTVSWLKRIGIAHPLVMATVNKADAAYRMGLQVALEDKPENLEQLRAAGINTVARHWAYNADWEPSVDSLGGFIERYL